MKKGCFAFEVCLSIFCLLVEVWRGNEESKAAFGAVHGGKMAVR